MPLNLIDYASVGVDKVKIKFGIQADKKGYTGKTDFAIGTVIIKNIIAHDFTETHTSTI